MSDYDRKDLEEKMICSKCSKLVEDTLLLTCEHNLCLPCASKNLNREDCKNIHKYKTIICDLCFNTTTLDNMTAKELINYLPQQINYNQMQRGNSTNDSNIFKKSINIIPNSNMNVNINDSLLNLSHLSKTQNNPNLSNLKREYCRDHSEELTYFCFDCQCRCICSECVVHGAHKNHEVINVKKAYPIIIERSEDLLLQVHNRIQEIQSVGQSIESKKRELNDNTNILKMEITKAFEEIIFRLQKKEKEILDKTEIFLQEHLQEMNTYNRVIQSNILSLNKLIDGINSHISRKDEVSLLNFYAENRNKIIKNVEKEIPEIPDFNSVFNMKVTVNQNSFESLINNLNAIHMEITSLKGFEVNKIQSSQQRFQIKRDLYGVKVNNNSSNNLKGNTFNNLNMSPSHFNYSSGDLSRNNKDLNVSFKSLTSQVEELNEKYKSQIN